MQLRRRYAAAQSSNEASTAAKTRRARASPISASALRSCTSRGDRARFERRGGLREALCAFLLRGAGGAFGGAGAFANLFLVSFLVDIGQIHCSDTRVLVRSIARVFEANAAGPAGPTMWRPKPIRKPSATATPARHPRLAGRRETSKRVAFDAGRASLTTTTVRPRLGS